MKTMLRMAVVFLLAASSVRAGTVVKVHGQVVDASGKPVAAVRIAALWSTEQGKPLEPYRPAVSDAAGTFSLEMEFFNRDQALLAFNSTGTLGGVANVAHKNPEKALRIQLSPLSEMRLRYSSEDAAYPLPESFVSVFLPSGRTPVAWGRSRDLTFSFKLPPGGYTVRGEGGGDRHERDSHDVALERAKALDLGEIKLPLTAIARLFGKSAPAWHFDDARGVPKNVQPASFKGKWVVLEFWGCWCIPCVGRGLPSWMDFAEDHAADRDKFAIVTVHELEIPDFKMLDEKLKPIIRRIWHGRSLPFPILLDTTGAMVKDYGVNRYPTAVLLDPQGRVVDYVRKPGDFGSAVCEEFLASKLTPLPTGRRIGRALDRAELMRVDDEPLKELMGYYSELWRVKIRLDPTELKAAGIDEKVIVPLKVSGRFSLRAWLNLTLDAFGLTYIPDNDGLRVVRRSAGNARLSQPSSWQSEENSLVAESLTHKVTFHFHDQSWKQVVATLESFGDETFLLDPSARRSGAIDLKATVSGSAEDESLSVALTRLLAPLKLTYVIRDEAVVITAGH